MIVKHIYCANSLTIGVICQPFVLVDINLSSGKTTVAYPELRLLRNTNLLTINIVHFRGGEVSLPS